MPFDPAVPIPVVEFCRRAGWGEIVSAEALPGGMISLTRRLTTTAGNPVVLKQSVSVPADLYAREAEGLQALRAAGMRAPTVLAATSDYLLLEDLGSAVPAEPDWAGFGRQIAQLHRQIHPRFGYARDNYLGWMPQVNGWMDDGHEFFGQRRVLRYAVTPLAQQTLSPDDQRRIERLVARLPQLIPPQPASLLHGDLWKSNMLFDGSGQPAVIDPAVYYGWAEAELSMTRQYEGVPRVFFDAYNEVNPLEPGWWERLEILYIREYLSIVAHFGDRHDVLTKIRALLDKFA